MERHTLKNHRVNSCLRTAYLGNSGFLFSGRAFVGVSVRQGLLAIDIRNKLWTVRFLCLLCEPQNQPWNHDRAMVQGQRASSVQMTLATFQDGVPHTLPSPDELAGLCSARWGRLAAPHLNVQWQKTFTCGLAACKDASTKTQMIENVNSRLSIASIRRYDWYRIRLAA